MSSKKDSKTDASQKWKPSYKQKDYAVAYIAARGNHAEACRKAKISRSSVSSWQKKQEFNDFLHNEVEKHRENVVSDHREKLRDAYGLAVDKLIELAKNYDYKAIERILEVVDPKWHDAAIRRIEYAATNDIETDNTLEIVHTVKQVAGHDPEAIDKALNKDAD